MGAYCHHPHFSVEDMKVMGNKVTFLSSNTPSLHFLSSQCKEASVTYPGGEAGLGLLLLPVLILMQFSL